MDPTTSVSASASATSPISIPSPTSPLEHHSTHTFSRLYAHSPFHRRKPSSSTIPSQANAVNAATTPMPPTPPINKSNNPLHGSSHDSSIRAAKARVKNLVRDDWDFPRSPDSRVPVFPYLDSAIVDWQERDYESSYDSSDSDNELSRSALNSHSQMQDPYRFESPDAIHFETLQEERRRKRRRKERDEMHWNEGLRVWNERRNLWCAARDRRKLRARRSAELRGAFDGNRDKGMGELIDYPYGSPLTMTISNSNQLQRQMTTTSNATTVTITPLDHPSDPEGSPATENYHHHQDDMTLSDLLDGGSQSSSDLNALPSPSHQNVHHHHHHNDDIGYPFPTTATANPPTPPTDVLLPIPPSILPKETTPIRASITPAIYPKIYSAIVIQGLTPTVPINLKNMTEALVDGWKAEGNWPPKATAPEASVARRRKFKKSASGMAGGLMGVLVGGDGRDGKDHGGAVDATPPAEEGKSGGDGRGHHRGKRSVSGAVKKVFGLDVT